MRGRKAVKRTLVPDERWQSPTVTKLINYVMHDGKRVTAAAVVYRALEQAADQLKKEPLEVLEGAINNVGPAMEVRGRRIGGANYQIPFEVARERRQILALRWMIDAAQARRGHAFSERLSAELVDAYKNEGTAVKKREDVHRMAEANRAFAHFARF